VRNLSFMAVGNTSTSYNRYICVDPLSLARLACAVHVDDPKKSFKIDSRRFWTDSRSRPSPSVVLEYLGDIPKLGIIRDCLFPILWQVNVFLILNIFLFACSFECHAPSFDQRNYNKTLDMTLVTY